jgi:hypothetical protein
LRVGMTKLTLGKSASAMSVKFGRKEAAPQTFFGGESGYLKLSAGDASNLGQWQSFWN